MSKYVPAVFQPTVRPAWAGILSYVSSEEKSQILEAIIRFPEDTGIKSKFWDETIKPDLEMQYTKFKKANEAKGCGSRTYWSKGEDMDKISLPYDKHMNNISISDGKDIKDKDKDNIRESNNKRDCKGEKEKEEIIQPAIDLWVAYKKERGQTYKPKGYEAMVKNLKELSGNNPIVAEQIVQQSMANNWSGLFSLKEQQNQPAKQYEPTENTESTDHKERAFYVDDKNFFIDDTMDCYKDALVGVPPETIEKVWKWIVENKSGTAVTAGWVIDRINQFKQDEVADPSKVINLKGVLRRVG